MNKTLYLKGKKYISASRAASITGYAGDYIGQLCRSKKITATLIGRSWYVLESEILEHKEKNLTTHKKTLKTRKLRKSGKSEKPTIRAKKVHAVSIGKTPLFATSNIRSLRQAELSYYKDNRELFPVLKKELNPESLKHSALSGAEERLSDLKRKTGFEKLIMRSSALVVGLLFLALISLSGLSLKDSLFDDFGGRVKDEIAYLYGSHLPNLDSNVVNQKLDVAGLNKDNGQLASSVLSSGWQNVSGWISSTAKKILKPWLDEGEVIVVIEGNNKNASNEERSDDIKVAKIEATPSQALTYNIVGASKEYVDYKIAELRQWLLVNPLAPNVNRYYVTKQNDILADLVGRSSGGTVTTVVSTGGGISLSDLSAAGPIAYDSGTGAFSFDYSTDNVWTGANEFSGQVTFSGITGSTQCLHVDENGVVSGTGADCGVGSASSFAWPFTASTGYVSTTTTLGLVSGFFSTASSTISGEFRLPALSQGFAYIGSTGKVDTIASSSVNLSWFNNDSGYITDGNTNWDNSYGFITGVNQLGMVGDVSTTTLANGYVLKYNSNNSKWESAATSTLGFQPAGSYLTSVAWGDIAGTLANQTDLQNALNAKISVGTTSVASITALPNLSITESQISDFGTYLTTISGLNISDLINDSGFITDGNTNWDNTYGFITSSALSSYVPTTRTLTINGTSYDLSANRSWTITDNTASSTLLSDSNTWTGTNTFSSLNISNLNLPNIAMNSVLSTDAAGNLVATSTPTFGSFHATSTIATSTISGGLSIGKGVNLGGYVYGAGLTSCSGSADKLIWNSATGQFSCGADAGAGGGLTALGAQYSPYQTGSSQTLATSTSGNITLTVTSSGDTHTFTPGVQAGYVIPLTASTTEWHTAYTWGDHSTFGYITDGNTNWDNSYGFITGSYSGFIETGTTSVSSITALPNLSITKSQVSDFGTYENPLTFSWPLSRNANTISWNGLATSSNLVSGQVLYATGANTFSSVATGTISVPTGLTVTSNRYTLGGSTAIGLDTGYVIPLSASTTNWNNFYNTPSNRITAGMNLAWNGNTLNLSTTTLNLTTSSFASNDISQWNNDSGYLTSLSGAASSTLLSDANTWTGVNNFTNASSNFAGTWQNLLPANFIAVGTTSVSSITSLPNLSITESQISDFGTYEVPLTFSGGLTRNVNDVAPTTGYVIPLTASTTNWNTFYNTPSSRITAGMNLVWNGNTLNLSTTTLNLTTSAFASNNISQWNNDSGYITSAALFAWPFTASANYVSTSTTLGLLDGFFSTASSTISGDFHLPSLSIGGLAVGANGLVYSAATTTAGTGLTYSGASNSFNVNTTQNIAKLSNLTSNGFVKTSNSDGTLIIDTTTYESGLTAGDGLTRTGNDFDCDTASGSTFGCLTSTDWNTFNNKVSYTDAAVNAYIHASSTIAKTYTANTFTAKQTFSYASTTALSSSYASSTLGYFGSLYAPQLSQGFAYLGSGGKLNSIASSSINLSWFNNDAGFLTSGSGLTSYDAFTHPAAGKSATTSEVWVAGMLSTASTTIVGNLTMAGNIMPNMTGATGVVSVRTIGDADNWFSDVWTNELHIGANSLYVNGKKAIHDTSDTMTFTTDADQNLAVKTTGTGNLSILTSTGTLYLNAGNQINMNGIGGIEIAVPNTSASKNLNLSNASLNGNITFTTTGANSQILSSAVQKIGLTAPLIEVTGNMTVSGTINSATISGGSLSATAMNGITTANIIANVATGTAGTVFNIATSTNTLTVNLPFADTARSGQLSAADWNSFNNKVSYTDSAVNAYIHASTTIPKTYSANVWSGANTFNNVLTLGSVAINSLISVNSSGQIVATSTPTFGSFHATSTTATSTISGGLSVGKGVNLGGYVYGAGLANCSASTGKLTWDASTGQFVCGTDAGSSGNGITAMGAQYSPVQTNATQTLATSTSGNVTLTVTSSGDTHTFTPGVASGYQIPLSTDITNWNTFYNTPSNRITAGLNLAWQGNTLNLSTTTMNLTTDSFASNIISQWANDAGYLTSATGLTAYDAFTHPAAGKSATTSEIWTAGLLSTASSTISGDLRLSSLSQGFAYIGSTGKVNTIASSSVQLSWFNNDSGYITSSALSSYVPTTRTLTINGTSYDLSADRSWNITAASLGALTSYDAWSHPAAGQSATTSLMQFFGQASTSQFTATSSVYLATLGGNVGIGTTSPYAKLSVAGGTSGTAIAVDMATGYSGKIFDLKVASTTKFSIDETGKITSVALAGSGDRCLYTDSNGNILAKAEDCGTSSFSNTLAEGGTATTTFYSGGVVFSDSTKLTQSSAAANFFWNETNKRLGLGTTTPTSVLSIAGSATVQSLFDIASSTGASMFNIGWDGSITQNISSASALDIQDGSGNSVFTVDTTSAGTDSGIDITAGSAQASNLLGFYASDGTTALSVVNKDGWFGAGTSTPQYVLTAQSNSAPQLALSAGAGFAQIAMRNDGSIFSISTTTVSGTATTSISALEIALGGFGTTTVRGLNIAGQATTTSNVGINLSGGCFAVDGACLRSATGNELSSYDAWTHPLAGYSATTSSLVIGASSTPYAKLSVSQYSAAGNTQPLFVIASSTGTGATSTAFMIDAYGNARIGEINKRTNLTVNGNSSILAGTFNVEGAVDMNSLTTGYRAQITEGYGLTSYSNGQDITGDILSVNTNSTSLGIIGGFGTVGVTLSGQVLDVDRSLYVGVFDTLNITGSVASFRDTSCTLTSGGACNSSANVVEVSQSLTQNTGSALNITTAATGAGALALRVNDDGTFTDTSAFVVDKYGNVGAGTTTPSYLLTIASSTAPQLALSAGAGFAQIAIRNDGSVFSISTTTVAGTATTSISALEIALGGFGTTTVRGLNIAGRATTTSNVGINLSGGCFAVDGVCISASGLGALTSYDAWSHPAAGQSATTSLMQFFGQASTSQFTATSSVYLATLGGNVGIGTTSPYAKLSVAGGTSGTAIAVDMATGYSGKIFDLKVASTTKFSIDETGKITSVALAGSGDRCLYTDSNGNILAKAEDCGTSSFSNTLAEGGTATTTFYSGGVVFSDSTKLTQSSAAANFFWNETNKRLGLGTSTPFAKLSVNSVAGEAAFVVGSSTMTSLIVDQNGNVAIGTSTPSSNLLFVVGTSSPLLSVNKNTAEVTVGSGDEVMRITTSGLVGIGTSTPYSKLSVWGDASGKIFEAVTSASTTALSISATGFGTTTVSGLNIAGSATTTSNVGINLSGGCFAINGTCITGGTSSGLTSYDAWTHPLSGYSATTSSLVIGASSSPFAKLSVSQHNGGTQPLFVIASSTGTSATSTYFTVTSTGGVAIGTHTTLSSDSFDSRLAVVTNDDVGRVFTGFNPNLSNGGVIWAAFGKSASALNSGWLTYRHMSDGNPNNYFSLGLYDADDVLIVNGQNRVGIGTTTPYSKLSIWGETTGSGVDAIAGIYASTTLSMGTASGFQFGNRFIHNVIGTQAGTQVGTFIRMIDHTDLANTVRGLEVQAFSGDNTAGVNTAIAAFGKTFGVHAYTDGLAGALAQPAAVFAEIGHPTNGNAIRAYSATTTSGTIVSIYHEDSDFTGTALSMDLGNDTGSWNSGYFMTLKNRGTSKVMVDLFGRAAFGTASIGSQFDIASSTSSSDVDLLRLISDVGGAGNVKFRVDSDGDVFTDGTTSFGTPADVAEMYPVSEDGLEAGDVVALSSVSKRITQVDDGGVVDEGAINSIEKAGRNSGRPVLGIVSTKPGIVLSASTASSAPVALVGRAPVKVSLDNGPIFAGDYLALSTTTPGVAVKALVSGEALGIALEDLTEISSTTPTVLTFLRIGWHNVERTLVLEGESQLSGDVVNPTEIAASSVTTMVGSLVVNQNGAGNILQLQSDGQDRFMVATSGSVSILAQVQNDTDAVWSISAATSTLPTGSEQASTTPIIVVNARGDMSMRGVLIVENDSAAGSVVTDAVTGIAEVDFGYHLGTGKPAVQLTTEGDVPAMAQVASWKKDLMGNYVGFVLRTFGLEGQVQQANVHYAVFGKQAGYTTRGDALPILTNVVGDESPISNLPDEEADDQSSINDENDQIGTSTEPEMTDTATTTPEIIETATTTPEIVESSEPEALPIVDPVAGEIVPDTASSTDIMVMSQN